MKKKTLALLIISTLVMVMTGCQNKDTDKSSDYLVKNYSETHQIEQNTETAASDDISGESNTETKQEENKDDFPVKLLDRELLPETITFNFKDQYGNDISSNDFIGKVLVLNFWATWCPDCIEEMPGLTDYYNKHKDDADLAILGEVTPNFHREGTVEEVVTYINENKIPFNNVIDDGGWLYDAYKIHSVPTTMVFDKEGKLVGFTRETLRSAEDFENFVNECLGS